MLGLQCPRLGAPVLGTLSLSYSLAGTPGLRIMVRVRTRSLSTRVFFTRWRNFATSLSTYSRK